MAQQVEHVTFEETVLVNDEAVKDYSDSDLMRMIQVQTKAADEMRATGIVGKYIDREVKHYLASASALSVLLDLRVKED